MASPITTFIRKVILFGDGLTFLLIAIGVLFSAEKTANLYGYTLNGIDGHNEFRAVYIGFWIGLTILFFTALCKIDLPVLGDIALVMVLLQSLGRVLSFVMDGMPDKRYIIVFFLEFVSSVIGLLMRPQLSANRS
ncbi:MAG TPA: DUF4345 family protein [Candidatus Angelobacter sp.]|nr:DUF4345 family protein [Candidatus Angelobacter sp.]